MAKNISHSNTNEPGSDHASGEKYFVRLNLHDRIQHHITWTTFVILAFTGFMVEFPEEVLLIFGPFREVAFYIRGLVHRIAAVVMVLNIFYQLWYIIFTKDGRQCVRDLRPRFQDARDMLQNMLYYLRFKDQKPLFDRFNYKEKMEYWTGWIGNIIITATGFFLWMEHLFPKFLLDCSILIHTMEAILATCAIMVWHFYEVHLKPGKFPMSKIFLDGLISEHELEEEHPLEYRRLKNS
jgi:cytochrome b subunit of formate dehydrogenase